jgi:5-methylcytosine-specific restriction endonuclease McrA
MNVAGMSNERLISELQGLMGQGRVLLARLLAYLAEVEERRLDLESACSSLFDFCLRRLAMSEDEACRRVAAARLTRRFPVALEMIERGELHLTGLLLLRDYLTNENHRELLKAASGKTKAEVQELIAARFPRRDAPPSIEPVAPALSLPLTAAAAPAVPKASQRHAVIEPLSPERYRVEFTASAELRDKIERARNLSAHQIPSGDLATLVERAFDVLLEKLERQRLGKTKRARRASDTRPSTRRGYVPMAVRREVFERDGEQCTFVDELGRRCPERAFLELDHRVPRARGGTDDAANLTVKCHRHNALAGERAFGRQFVEKRKAERTQRLLQRGYDDVKAARALRGLGFKEAEIRRALSTLEELWAGSPPPLETILRDAIQVLT